MEITNGTILFIISIIISIFLFYIRKNKKIEKYNKGVRKENEKLYKVSNLPVFKLPIDNNITDPNKKAKHIEKLTTNFKLCIKHNICPKCGKLLEKYSWDNNDEWHLEFYNILFCKNCQKRTEQIIEYCY